MCLYSLCYFHHYPYSFSLYLVHDVLQNSVLFFLSSYPLTLILLKAPLTIFISNYSLAFCNRPPAFVLQEHVRYRPATHYYFIMNMPFVCHQCHYMTISWIINLLYIPDVAKLINFRVYHIRMYTDGSEQTLCVDAPPPPSKLHTKKKKKHNVILSKRVSSLSTSVLHCHHRSVKQLCSSSCY